MPVLKSFSLGRLIRILILISVFNVVTPSLAAADELSDWYRSVAKRVAKKHIYPRSALSREIEGRAEVEVTISLTGEILKYEIKKETGKTVLDKAIPKMMRRINPLPKPPEGVDEGALTFVLPISWRLN